MSTEEIGTIVVWVFAGIGVLALACAVFAWRIEVDSRKTREHEDRRNLRRLETEWDAMNTLSLVLNSVPSEQRGDWFQPLHDALNAEAESWNRREQEERWKRIVH